jgi:hypothetical protein
MINFNAYVDENTYNLYKESLYNFNIWFIYLFIFGAFVE